MKPVFETVVFVSPKVWNIYPLPSRIPAKIPLSTNFLLRPRKAVGRYINIRIDARINLDAKNENTSCFSRESFITTNDPPHTAAAPSIAR
jgi:hypothetical protein